MKQKGGTKQETSNFVREREKEKRASALVSCCSEMSCAIVKSDGSK
jgi:hypothetical protein